MEMKKYNTSIMEKCEYINHMKNSYVKEPKQKDGKCAGFKNLYVNTYSTVCQNCPHWSKEIK